MTRIKAILPAEAREGVFSEADWKSGVPQRRGWIEKMKERKTVPKDIVDFVFKKKPKVEPLKEVVKAEAKPEPEPKKTPAKKTEKKTVKTKKNDNPKPKRRASGTDKPGAMGKA